MAQICSHGTSCGASVVAEPLVFIAGILVCMR